MAKTWKDYLSFVDNTGWSPEWFDRPVEVRNGSISVFQNVKVRPSSMNKRVRRVRYNIFSEDGSPIQECCYLRGHNLKVFDYVEDVNCERTEASICIEKPVIYLGWMNPHYGHFLMESLCRLWVLKYLKKDILDNCIYYYDIHTSTDDILSKSWILIILDLFGIDSRNLIFGDKNYLFNEFLVPSQAMTLHHSVMADHQSYIFNVITKSFRSTFQTRECKKIYLSRSGLIRDKRILSNEKELENALRSIGFYILHPETLSFEEQIIFYSNAELIIGPSGSALHNAAFMKKGSRIISLTTRDFCLLNELLCCYAKQVDYTLFICDGDSRDSWSAPIVKLVDYLSKLNEIESSY